MIYELALVAKAESTDDQRQNLCQMVRDVVKSFDGDVLIEDDWGTRQLAQPYTSGERNAHMLYFMYKSNNEANKELTRRLGINETAVRSMIFKLSDTDEKAGEFVKKFKTPFSKKYNGSLTDEESEEGAEGAEGEKPRRRFSRRRSCWFTAKGITADWKDPNTYAWLVNEFGKISPARISGISRKHQRWAETAIKRARNLGLLSHLSDKTLE